MDFEIIDFHTHPFNSSKNNICPYGEHCGMTEDTTLELMDIHNVSKFCGSVICRKSEYELENDWQAVRMSNDTALKLMKKYNGRYIPGFHIHPGYVRESCEEIEKMSKLGLNLIGELVPYMHGWGEDGYNHKNIDEILDVAQDYNMVVSFHSDNNYRRMTDNHPKLKFIVAHPDEYGYYMNNLDILKKSENVYLDISGYGVFRQNMLRYGIDKVGVHKFIFGSDYPTCSLSMYIGAVLLDTGINDEEKKCIFSKNIKRILSI